MLKAFQVLVILMALALSHRSLASGQSLEVEVLKEQIFQLASSYEGQDDPDGSKQRSLDSLVLKLIQGRPMPPIKERIPLLKGVWKQVWGPYSYGRSRGGIDPRIGIKEIYQVVFEEGYYYNVAPYYPDGDGKREQISLLRGEFTLDSENTNGLKVRFTKYPGAEQRPENLPIWKLPSLVEKNQLENEITIVPRWIVWAFFGGGKLDEVYTDSDMRIVYGSSHRNPTDRSIYIMRRVEEGK